MAEDQDDFNLVNYAGTCACQLCANTDIIGELNIKMFTMIDGRFSLLAGAQ